MFDYENGNDILFLKMYNKLVKDCENRFYYDVLFYEMGVFYDKKKEWENVLKFYNKFLVRKFKDFYLVVLIYWNIGNMYFKDMDYIMVVKYYDSILIKLNFKIREFVFIEKNRKNLDNVIKYEGIVKCNDSIIKVKGLLEFERKIYFENYIVELKKKDEVKWILEEKEKERLVNIE